MKNIIIAAMGAYIFYGFCEVKHIIILFAAFALFLEVITSFERLVTEIRKDGRGFYE